MNTNFKILYNQIVIDSEKFKTEVEKNSIYYPKITYRLDKFCIFLEININNRIYEKEKFSFKLTIPEPPRESIDFNIINYKTQEKRNFKNLGNLNDKELSDQIHLIFNIIQTKVDTLSMSDVIISFDHVFSDKKFKKEKSKKYDQSYYENKLNEYIKLAIKKGGPVLSWSYTKNKKIFVFYKNNRVETFGSLSEAIIYIYLTANLKRNIK